jgi:hypothetical protein
MSNSARKGRTNFNIPYVPLPEDEVMPVEEYYNARTKDDFKWSVLVKKTFETKSAAGSSNSDKGKEFQMQPFMKLGGLAAVGLVLAFTACQDPGSSASGPEIRKNEHGSPAVLYSGTFSDSGILTIVSEPSGHIDYAVQSRVQDRIRSPAADGSQLNPTDLGGSVPFPAWGHNGGTGCSGEGLPAHRSSKGGIRTGSQGQPCCATLGQNGQRKRFQNRLLQGLPRRKRSLGS